VDTLAQLDAPGDVDSQERKVVVEDQGPLDMTGWQVVRVYLVIRALQGTQDCLATKEEKEKRAKKGHKDTREQVVDRDHRHSLELEDHQVTKE
jgi:hypothetical protein